MSVILYTCFKLVSLNLTYLSAASRLNGTFLDFHGHQTNSNIKVLKILICLALLSAEDIPAQGTPIQVKKYKQM